MYHIQELIKLNKTEKITHIISILFHLYIKFQVQTLDKLAITKKMDRLMSLDLSDILFFTVPSLLRF
jgi:hypothetical protein